MRMELTRRMERTFIDLQARHGRKKSEFCLCEGVRCCSEVLASPAAADIAMAVVSEKLKSDIPGLQDLPLAGIQHTQKRIHRMLQFPAHQLLIRLRCLQILDQRLEGIIVRIAGRGIQGADLWQHFQQLLQG